MQYELLTASLYKKTAYFQFCNKELIYIAHKVCDVLTDWICIKIVHFCQTAYRFTDSDFIPGAPYDGATRVPYTAVTLKQMSEGLSVFLPNHFQKKHELYWIFNMSLMVAQR